MKVIPLTQNNNTTKKRFVFHDVDLSHTMASMRCIWKGRDGTGQKITRELEVSLIANVIFDFFFSFSKKKVHSLNLSFTVTSSRSIASLFLMKNLTELHLDHCSSLKKSKHFFQLIAPHHSTGEKLFSILMQKDTVPSLEVLSVVGTSDVFASNWFDQVRTYCVLFFLKKKCLQAEAKCPKLRLVYFTRQPGTKAIGWNDAILMQTMRDPLLLPCGHIADRHIVISNNQCSFDRQIPISNCCCCDLFLQTTIWNKMGDSSQPTHYLLGKR